MIIAVMAISLCWIAGWYALYENWKSFSNKEKVGYLLVMIILGPIGVLPTIAARAHERTPTKPVLNPEEYDRFI